MRRSTFDPLEIGDKPTWYVVTNMHRAVLEVRPLPAGTDLKRVFAAAMLEWMDAGWKLSEFGSRIGAFFCTRGVERLVVGITPTDPGCARRV
jgi:hypothetical protein